MPILNVADVMASAEFFVGKLGFSMAGHWDDDEGPSFAIVQMDLVTVGLARSKAKASDGWAAYVYVEDIDAFTDQVLAKGVTLARGPEDSFYGCREIELDDPDNNRLCFAQDLKPGADGPGL